MLQCAVESLGFLLTPAPLPLVLLLVQQLTAAAGWSCSFPKSAVPTYPQILHSAISKYKKSKKMRLYPLIVVNTDSISTLKCAEHSKSRTVGLMPLPTADKWPGGTVPYVIDNTYPETSVQQILKDMRPFNNLNCVKFIPRTVEPVYIRFVNPGNTDIYEILTEYEKHKEEVEKTENITEDLRYGGPVERIGYSSRLPNLLVRSSSDIDSPGVSIMGSLMRVLGFNREEVRHDRDDYIKIEYYPGDYVARRMLEKELKTELDLQFPYDSLSATHITKSEARDLNVRLSALDPVKTEIKEYPDHTLSQIDIEKIKYVYCNRSSTFGIGGSGSGGGAAGGAAGGAGGAAGGAGGTAGGAGGTGGGAGGTGGGAGGTGGGAGGSGGGAGGSGGGAGGSGGGAGGSGGGIGGSGAGAGGTSGGAGGTGGGVGGTNGSSGGNLGGGVGGGGTGGNLGLNGAGSLTSGQLGASKSGVTSLHLTAATLILSILLSLQRRCSVV